MIKQNSPRRAFSKRREDVFQTGDNVGLACLLAAQQLSRIAKGGVVRREDGDIIAAVERVDEPGRGEQPREDVEVAAVGVRQAGGEERGDGGRGAEDVRQEEQEGEEGET